MQLNTLKRKNKNKKKITVGRGGTRGKTSGRGTKGQNARAGRKKRPELRDIIKKLPKQRGRGKNIFQSIQEKPVVISLTVLDNALKGGEVVTPAFLVEVGLVSKKSGKIPAVKILAGEAKKSFIVSKCAISTSAKEAILKAGGKVE